MPQVGRPWSFFAWVAIACAGAIALYWPALNGPFYADDYIYLDAAKQLSFTDYLRASLDPRRPDEFLILAEEFWRPLYFVSMGMLEAIFGSGTTGYHVVNLLSHLAGTVLVGVLAMRLAERVEAGVAAAVVFAVHPAAFEAVAWISALNSVAVPLGLASWLAFERAVPKDGSTDRRWLALSVGLLALALGFRETAVAFIPAMAVWYGVCRIPGRWRDWRSWTPLVPFAVLVVAHHVVRTRFLTEPASADNLYAFDSGVISQAWEMLTYSLYPFEETASSAADFRTVVILAAVALAAFARRWLPVVLFGGLLAMIAPFVALTFGMGPRYFYAPSALLALFVGALVAEGARWADSNGRLTMARRAGAVVLAGWLVFCVAVGNDRVREWEGGASSDVEAFAMALRAEHPTLPEGGTLYVANPPIDLAIFGAANLLPTVRYSYPEIGGVQVFDPADEAEVRARLGPDDRMFVFEP